MSHLKDFEALLGSDISDELADAAEAAREAQWAFEAAPTLAARALRDATEAAYQRLAPPMSLAAFRLSRDLGWRGSNR